MSIPGILLVVFAAILGSTDGAVVPTAGEVKDCGSDEDTAAEDRVKRTAGKTPKPHPLKHKGSIAIDMLVSNLVRMWAAMVVIIISVVIVKEEILFCE